MSRLKKKQNKTITQLSIMRKVRVNSDCVESEVPSIRKCLNCSCGLCAIHVNEIRDFTTTMGFKNQRSLGKDNAEYLGFSRSGLISTTKLTHTMLSMCQALP